MPFAVNLNQRAANSGGVAALCNGGFIRVIYEEPVKKRVVAFFDSRLSCPHIHKAAAILRRYKDMGK